MSSTCVSPPELEDRQLLAYLDDPEAHPETALHLDTCPYCRERAEALDQLHNRLKNQLSRVDCPSSIELGEYHLGLLPAAQRLVIGQHVRTCPHCAREVEQLEEFLGDPAPPREYSPIKVLLARFVGGPAGFVPTPASAGLRGVPKGPIPLEADGIVITLTLEPEANGQISISGEVAAPDQDHWTGALVKMRPTNSAPRTTSLDDLGAFGFEGLRPDTVEFTIISTHGIAVLSPKIDIAL